MNGATLLDVAPEQVGVDALSSEAAGLEIGAVARLALSQEVGEEEVFLVGGNIAQGEGGFPPDRAPQG